MVRRNFRLDRPPKGRPRGCGIHPPRGGHRTEGHVDKDGYPPRLTPGSLKKNISQRPVIHKPRLSHRAAKGRLGFGRHLRLEQFTGFGGFNDPAQAGTPMLMRMASSALGSRVLQVVDRPSGPVGRHAEIQHRALRMGFLVLIKGPRVLRARLRHITAGQVVPDGKRETPERPGTGGRPGGHREYRRPEGRIFNLT